MLLPQTPSFRKRPGKPLRRRAALTLVAADREGDPVTGDWRLRLAFDRPVDVSALAPGQVTMDDAAGAGWVYAATAPGPGQVPMDAAAGAGWVSAATGIYSRPDPRTLVLALAQTDRPAEDDATFTATPANGLKAADEPGGGGAWAGVVRAPLPYP